MRAKRGWVSTTSKQDGAIGHLSREVAALIRRIDALEKADHRTQAEVELLKTSALVLARQIEEVASSQASDLPDLLRK